MEMIKFLSLILFGLIFLGFLVIYELSLFDKKFFDLMSKYNQKNQIEDDEIFPRIIFINKESEKQSSLPQFREKYIPNLRSKHYGHRYSNEFVEFLFSDFEKQEFRPRKAFERTKEFINRFNNFDSKKAIKNEQFWKEPENQEAQKVIRLNQKFWESPKKGEVQKVIHNIGRNSKKEFYVPKYPVSDETLDLFARKYSLLTSRVKKLEKSELSRKYAKAFDKNFRKFKKDQERNEDITINKELLENRKQKYLNAAENIRQQKPKIQNSGFRTVRENINVKQQKIKDNQNYEDYDYYKSFENNY